MSKVVIDSEIIKRFSSMQFIQDGDTVTISFPDVNSDFGTIADFAFAAMNFPLKNLDNIPWSVINKIGLAGNARKFFALGATKKDYMKNGYVAEYRILGFDHDDLADDSGKAPISWGMARVYKDDMVMRRDSEPCGWEKTDCRYTLNGEFYNLMSDELRAIIKPVWKLTANENGNLIQTKDLVWLMSEQEQFGRKIYSNGGEGHWYELFRQEDVPYGMVDDDGDQRWMWLRSPSASGTAGFCRVNTYGSANGNYSGYSAGVAPGFAS